MAFTQDFRTQRRNYNDGDTRIGEKDRLWYDSNTNSIRISDGETPGGIAVGGAGGSDYTLPTATTTVKGGVKVDGTTITISNQVISGFSGDYDDLTNKPDLSVYQLSTNAFSGSYTDLTNKPTIPNRLSIGLINSQNTLGELFSDVSILRFDSDSGFDVIDLGNGSIKVAMNSTFKTWKVDGQNDLIATGLDTIEFESGTGITITTDPNASPNKKITFTGFSGSYTDLTNKPTKSVTLYQDGTLQVTTGTVRWHNPTPLEIDKVVVRLASAADQTVTVVIKKSNTTFRTIEVSANSTKVVVNNLNLEMVDDDFLTVDVTTVGNTAKGSGLSVEFFYTMV
jgi:hypothetical protein